MKREQAITLISLVITIIVLIILASVAIYLSLGNNGIFTRTKEAKEATNKQAATEIINLKITTAQMNKYAEKQEMPTLKELSLILKEDSEITYVTESSKVASAEYDVPSENPTSIYTKLNKYPYEFEINGELQLASINGVKVANTNSDNQDANQPTGLRTDAYIYNETLDTESYTSKTSMSGLSVSKDQKNNIDEYLSYSKDDGYTVLKSGWYLINVYNNLKSDTSVSTTVKLNINNRSILIGRAWANKNGDGTDVANLSIFLSKGNKFYFDCDGTNIPTSRVVRIYCYPMF